MRLTWRKTHKLSSKISMLKRTLYSSSRSTTPTSAVKASNICSKSREPKVMKSKA